MKPEHKTAIEEKYLTKLFKNGKTLRDLDALQCPCPEEQAKNCNIYGYYPQYCKPIQTKIETILKS